ncbi:MAG TPA: 50S ribosomal protein L29 [Gemmatimonadaceae bacterium]|nr:50S ribosomal protein L29 [Gemmatimonadaceae bacterium]
MLSKDIREMSEGDIRMRIAELEEERFRLKFRAGTETLEDPLRLRVIRKDIARLNTVLREKIIGIVEAGTSASLPKARSAKKTRVSRRSRTGSTRSRKRA